MSLNKRKLVENGTILIFTVLGMLLVGKLGLLGNFEISGETRYFELENGTICNSVTQNRYYNCGNNEIIINPINVKKITTRTCNGSKDCIEMMEENKDREYQFFFGYYYNLN